jgi:hypothetical protein
MGVKEDDLLPVAPLYGKGFLFQITPRPAQKHSEEQPRRHVNQDGFISHQPPEKPIIVEHCFDEIVVVLKLFGRCFFVRAGWD